MNEYPELFLALGVAALAAVYTLWHRALAARERANAIARETCLRAVVQFLDETVAFTGFRLRRDARGRFRILRTYTFDYTPNGRDREQGFVVLAGQVVESVGLAS